MPSRPSSSPYFYRRSQSGFAILNPDPDSQSSVVVPAGVAKLARREGLKIPWVQTHPGSIPGPGIHRLASSAFVRAQAPTMHCGAAAERRGGAREFNASDAACERLGSPSRI